MDREVHGKTTKVKITGYATPLLWYKTSQCWQYARQLLSIVHHIVTQYHRVCVCVGSLLHIWVNVSLTEATLGQCKCCWQAEEMMWNMQNPETTRLENQSTHQFDISSKNSTTDFVRYREATAITQDTSNLTRKNSRNDSIIYTFFHIPGKSTTACACCLFPQFCFGLGSSRLLLFSTFHFSCSGKPE